MADSSRILELRLHYIELSKTFFAELDNGKTLDELQPLQQQIERTLLELDRLETGGSSEKAG